LSFVNAQSDYPIVFAGTRKPCCRRDPRIAGRRESLPSSDGKWDARYIPAFVRRYPLCSRRAMTGRRFNLCIDEQFAGFNGDGRGERLFTDDGKPTTYVENILKFLQSISCNSTALNASAEDPGARSARADAGAGGNEFGREVFAWRFMAINREN